MFSKAISQTPMTSPEADGFFSGRIMGANINGDTTFLATLRALIYPRLPEGESLFFEYTRSNYNKSAIGDLDDKTIIRTIAGDFINNCNVIHVHNFCNMDGGESNRAWMDVFEKKFESVYSGWHRVEKVTTFYRNVFHSLCYINPDKKSTILFVDLSTQSTPMDVRRMHYLQCGIFAFLPWYFDPSQGVTELEKELVNSLREKSETNYLACLAKMAEAYDFRTARIRTLLRGYELSFEQNRLREVSSQLDSIERELRNLDDRYSRYLQEKREQQIVMLGLETKIAQGCEESEIMDYFLANRDLILRDVTGDGRLVFIVRGTLDIFDEDNAERCIDNPNSEFYRYTEHGVFTKENIKMLMTEIFLEQRLKINVCAAYSFSMNGRVRGIQDYGDYGMECADYTPNPHIDRFGCLGNHERYINQLLSQQDYIGALAQCVSSCRSLAFTDGAVMREFAARICGRSDFNNANMKCIVLPDGSVVAPQGAIEWLLKEKEPAEPQEVEEA